VFGLNKFATILFTIMALTLATASNALAERRLALVIGNGAYSVGPLDNPPNDAALMADTLSNAGFEVTHLTDLGYRDLQRAVVEFGRDLAAAGRETVGMVFYAGHAVQANGENYLIPVDADIRDELDLDIQTLRIDTLMRGLDRAGNRLNMVVLDACRNNPFKSMSRSGTRGLAKIDAASGTLLAYSTAPGDVAADGSDRNSPYTAALVKAIRTPGLPVEQVFKRVRIEVMERTGERQVPWESSSLTGDFTFIDRAPVPVVAAPPPPPPAAPAAPDNSAEIAFWTSIANSDDPALFRSYLNSYPNGLFAAVAEQRIAALEAANADRAKREREAAAADHWNAVKDSDDSAMLQTVIDRYDGTLYAELARTRIETLNARAAAVQAAGQNQVAAIPAAAPPPAGGSGGGERWRIDWRVVNGTGSDLCQPGETAEQEFEVRDGQFSFDVKTTRYSKTTLTGEIGEDELSFWGLFGGNGSPRGFKFEVVLAKTGDGEYGGRTDVRPTYNHCLWEISVGRVD
jgi:uncharacterized caspase-like protein